MSAGGSRRAIIAALTANAVIAAVKFVAAAITGSASMLAEGVHSVVDTGNQGLLLYGGRRATRERDHTHPFGYGRERYFYSFAVALMLFSAGGLFALYEGWHKINESHEIDDAPIALGVLVVAMIAEALSLRTARREANHVRGDASWVSFIRHTKNPELPVVLLEDTAALTGLALAFLGVLLAWLTGNAVWDGVGTMAIGALLVLVAAVLAVETKSLLLGESASSDVERRIREALVAGPEIESVIHLRTVHIGPEELLLAAKIAVRHDETAAEIARGIDAAERRVREAVPIARHIYLEPDLRRTQSPGPDGG